MSIPPNPDRDSRDADLELLFRSQAPLESELARQEAEAQIQPLLHRIAALEEQVTDLKSRKDISYAAVLHNRVQRRNFIFSMVISQQKTKLEEATGQVEALREQLAREGREHADIKRKYEELRRTRPDKQEVALLMAQMEMVEDQNEALRTNLAKLESYAAGSSWVLEAVDLLDRLQHELQRPRKAACKDELQRVEAQYKALIREKIELDDGLWQLSRLIESSHQEAESAGRLLPLAAVCAEIYLESKAARKTQRRAEIEHILTFEPSSVRFLERNAARTA